MKLGVDFDRVVFRTDEFNAFLKDEIEGLEHTEEPPYDDNDNYDPEKHARLLDIHVEKVYRVTEDIAQRFLYPDTKKLEQLPAKVIIVSRGHEKFQRLKIENSGVLEHVDGYEIVQQGPKDACGIDFLVDDVQQELDMVGVPGFLFDREKHTMEDVVEKVKQHEA